jgi:hypothetical protein
VPRKIRKQSIMIKRKPKYGARDLFDPKGSVYVIGDIQGSAVNLSLILKKIEKNLLPVDHVVFVGDLMDGGDDSPGVLRLIRDFKIKHKNTFVIFGNHELFFNEYLNGNVMLWLANNGKRTIQQFNLEDESAEGFKEYLEKEKLLTVITETIPYYETEDLVITHAPLDAEALDMLGGMDDDPTKIEGVLERMGDRLIWNFCESEKESLGSFEKVNVCGHQHGKVQQPRFYKPSRIYLDTGCGYRQEAALACVQFPEMKLYLSSDNS